MLDSNILKGKYPFLIDGGLSNVLEKQDQDLNHKLWTAKLLEKNPEAIIQAHLAYLNAGAQCITTASYQASIRGLIENGYDKPQAKKLILRSVELAETAIKSGDTDYRPLIAASVGPFGAYLADGSEYRGNYGILDEELKDFHIERIEILDDSITDLLACETIPNYQEAKVLADILTHVKKPAWISFSCKDEQHVNDGTKIEDCVSLFKNHPKVFAVGINCTHPKYVSGLIESIKSSNTDKDIVVYPNSGEVYNATTKTWKGLSDPDHFVAMSKEWISQGADIIGGCCRIGPDHIGKLSSMLSPTK